MKNSISCKVKEEDPFIKRVITMFMEEISRNKNVSSQQVFSIYFITFRCRFYHNLWLLFLTIRNQKLKNDAFYYSYAT